MSGPSGREEQGRKSEQPVPAEPSRFSLKRLFNWLAGCLPLTPLFNAFARPSGPRPEPIKIDPAWFPVPEPTWQPAAAPEPPHELDNDDGFDSYAFAHDNPGWDEELPDDEPDYISVHPGERVPWDAGELLRTYYAPGIGDVCIYARREIPDEEIHPDQIIELDEWDNELAPESTPKPPK